jgi:hypothetical protein
MPKKPLQPALPPSLNVNPNPQQSVTKVIFGPITYEELDKIVTPVKIVTLVVDVAGELQAWAAQVNGFLENKKLMIQMYSQHGDEMFQRVAMPTFHDGGKRA